jgi:hypothetical protein
VLKLGVVVLDWVADKVVEVVQKVAVDMVRLAKEFTAVVVDQQLLVDQDRSVLKKFMVMYNRG